MTVLYTHYLSKINIGSNWLLPIIGCVLCVVSILLLIAFEEVGDKLIFISFISSLAIGICFLAITYKLDNTLTNYVDYKEVLFEENEIGKEIFESYKIKEIRGDIYVIEPINPIEEEREDNNGD